VKQAIKKFKNNRTPGPDDINAEMIKAGKPVLLDRIHKIISWVQLTEKLPPELEKASYAPY
jgi:hypothetical protein